MKTYFYEFEDNEDFEFEPNREEVENAIQDILLSEANVNVNRYQNQDCSKLLDYIVYKMDLLERFEEELEEELHQYFEEKAKEQYEVSILEQQDKDDWYGTRTNVIGL